jgi:hypothetical protein
MEEWKIERRKKGRKENECAYECRSNLRKTSA